MIQYLMYKHIIHSACQSKENDMLIHFGGKINTVSVQDIQSIFGKIYNKLYKIYSNNL